MSCDFTRGSDVTRPLSVPPSAQTLKEQAFHFFSSPLLLLLPFSLFVVLPTRRFATFLLTYLLYPEHA